MSILRNSIFDMSCVNFEAEQQRNVVTRNLWANLISRRVRCDLITLGTTRGEGQNNHQMDSKDPIRSSDEEKKHLNIKVSFQLFVGCWFTGTNLTQIQSFSLSKGYKSSMLIRGRYIHRIFSLLSVYFTGKKSENWDGRSFCVGNSFVRVWSGYVKCGDWCHNWEHFSTLWHRWANTAAMHLGEVFCTIMLTLLLRHESIFKSR